MADSSPRETRRYVVLGRVQGVGFRYYVRGKAAEIGLLGWVRNRPDGSVEAEAAGQPAQLEAFELALRAGPPLARVDHLAISPAPPSRETSFRITG